MRVVGRWIDIELELGELVSLRRCRHFRSRALSLIRLVDSRLDLRESMLVSCGGRLEEETVLK